jgi:hypothetical protein
MANSRVHGDLGRNLQSAENEKIGDIVNCKNVKKSKFKEFQTVVVTGKIIN